MMKHKWQYYIIGLLSGFLISGIVFIGFSTFVSQDKHENLWQEGSFDYRLPKSQTEIPGNVSSIDSTRNNLGKIDLNSSNMDELMSLPNIGETRAKAIIEFREKYGEFENVNELLYVSGIGKSIVDGLKGLVYIP